MIKKLFLGCTILFVSSIGKAQDDDLSKLVDEHAKVEESDKQTATFKTTRLINLTTNEQVKKGELDFRIAHRFDDIAGSNGGASTFFGFDNVSDIRFSFDYGISDRWQIGIGRSKGAYAQRQVFDLNSKFKILEQRVKGLPIGLSVYAGATYTTMPSSGSPSTTTNFSKLPYRFNYFGQLLIVRKFSSSLSAIVSPTIVHRNIVNIGDNNTTYAIAAGLRMKISKRSAIIADYYQVLNVSTYQKAKEFQMPIGLGYELETGGHVFHVLLSNNRGLMESQFLPENYDNPTKGQIRLGFNISRIFTILKDSK